MSAPTAPSSPTPPPVPAQRRTKATTTRTTRAKPAAKPKPSPEVVEVPTERVPAPDVPPGVESPITVWSHTFDPGLEPIGAQLAVETASAL